MYHVKDCPMWGCDSVTTCPCCGRQITRRRAFRDPPPYEQVVEAALRERPVSGFDVDGNQIGALE
jgi:hypothetical protein